MQCNAGVDSPIGKSRSNLSQKISEIAKQIVTSGTEPSDLKFLIAAPYTKGTSDIFKFMAALQVSTAVLRNRYSKSFRQLIEEFDNTYLTLIQMRQYHPAQGGKVDSDAKIRAMIAKEVAKQVMKCGARLITSNAEQKHK